MYLVFWTLSYLTFSSMSNLPRLLIPFGLQHTLTPLQHPIHRACSSLLDFLVPYLRFNVQFTVYPPPPQKGVEFFAPVGAKPRSTGPRAKTPFSPFFFIYYHSPVAIIKMVANMLRFPHTFFPMDQRGVEPLSENPFPVLLLS